ncbi:hypothetical protein [Phaeovulum sp.]|uniref:hypothetical protein n=1 Tax=Phaeovulum sp. TaxID=2934796 RepID=UPI003564EEA7
MAMATTILHRSILIGGVLIATTLGAEAATVSRCSVLDGDTYVPTLMIEINGQQEMFRIGERGLTRSIVFDAEKAINWARAQINGSATWVAGDSCGSTFVSAANDYDSDDDGGCGGL